MTKKTITLNELRSIVKQIIKEYDYDTGWEDDGSDDDSGSFNNIIGFYGKDISDFHIKDRIKLDNGFSIIIVFVDDFYRALLINDNEEKVIKEITSARNHQNLLQILDSEYNVK